MASGGNSRQTGTIPKTVRNNSNIPQEVVTPTRRDIHATSNSSVDWLPVSEQNTRTTQNRTRKSTNIQADNEFSDLDLVSQERGSRFVPVRPQPRSLVLRQRDSMGDHTEDSYNNLVGGNSPHTSHAAIMIVNPTTPNSNQANQSMNASGSMNRNNVRGGSMGRDTSSYSSNTVPVCPHPINAASNKSTNIHSNEQLLDNMVFQNGNGHNNYHDGPSNTQPEALLPRSEAVRTTGDNIVAACPDAARVEQRLGQIREYIRVTSSLVESMRNSEDELKKRLSSLKQCNAVLAAQVRAMDGEEDCQIIELQPEGEEQDDDLQELLDTLQNLKDSEKKLEDMLEYLNDKVNDANTKINNVCNDNNTPLIKEVTDNENKQVHIMKGVEDDKESGADTTTSEYASVSELRDEDVLPPMIPGDEQEGAARPTSAQSSFSAYSDNELYQNEIKTNMDLTQIRLAAALQEQRRLLKYQAEAKEQLAEIQMSRNMENAGNSSHNDLSSHQDHSSSSSMYATPPNIHQPLSSAKVYGINQIGVATTLPHISENNYNWNNQGNIVKRSSTSSERDNRLDTSETRNKASTSSTVQPDQTEMDMLRDLQMRRHHLESQVSKIQNLHTASSSFGDAIPGSTGTERASTEGRPWGGSEASEEDRMGQGTSSNSIRNKVATVNVMKAELERLKNMLRTVDSIQSNFGINSTIDDDNIYDNENHVTHDNVTRNRNRASESSMSNHISLSRRDSSSSTKNTMDGQDCSQVTKNQNIPLGLLSRLQNCISSTNKCTNVSEPHQTAPGDMMGSELLAIQQLTDELKQAAQGLSDERRRLKHISNREVCTSSGSSIKSEDKKQTNSNSGGNTSSLPITTYPPYSGPAERKQLVLKAELEAKKKQLERLMSKDVDHRTNQHTAIGGEGSSNKEIPSGEVSTSAIKIDPSCSYQNIPLSNDIHNGYSSSEQEDDDVYLSSSHNQLNINQPNEEPSRKSPSRCSSPDNLKDESCYFGDSTRSLDGSFISQTIKHNKLQKVNKSSGNKQQNKGILQMCTSLDAPTGDAFQGQVRDNNRPAAEACIGGRTVSQDRDGLRGVKQPLSDCFLGIPANNSSRTKDVCDVSNMSNTSSSSSGGDRDPVPPPMAALPLPTRHRHATKSNRDNLNADSTSPQWHNPHVESQVTMWWHNKANQLQQQLELTTNLCQSLLQDKRTSQTSPSTLNSCSQATLNLPGSMVMHNVPGNISNMIPGVPALQQYQSNPMLNASNMGNPYYPLGGFPQPGYYPMDAAGIPPMWSYQQQQLAAQQHQVAAAAWGSAQCIQHLLTQQREISMLRTTLSNLEERMQSLNVNMPRAHSTPPNINYTDNFTHLQAMRTNSVQSNFQQAPQHMWPTNHFNNDNSTSSHIPQNVTNVHPSNFTQTRTPTSKLIPNVSPFPIDHFNNQQPPANFSISSNVFQHDTLPDQINCPSTHSNVSVMSQFFNNSAPQPPVNPNAISNQNVPQPQPLQNNRNPNSLVNLTPHAAAISNVQCVHPIGQPLTGQSMALNNQVPPGNRANNYWDNFRSYSRQNLLSGNTKVNAGVSLTHSPHPLVERSHNTLHTGTPPGSVATNTNTQVTNTPKRDVNLQSNSGPLSDNDSTQRRGRRNLSQDATYFTAPPDVLNVNQNVDMEPVQQSVNLLANADTFNDNRLHDTHNININRSINPIPEIIQAHSNNLNVPRSYGAYKKKSSSKLPAKNACNTGNYTAPSSHNRNVETHNQSSLLNPNLASTSGGENHEKSTTKLFDLLRENVYSEVTALISANESRPHFLIQLFRDLQQISSDTLRQRALQSIQELVSHYLSNVDAESYEMNENANAHNTTDTHIHANNSHDNAIGLHIDNEIVKFILAHHSDTCTTELLEALCHVIVATIGNVSNHSLLNQRLSESFANYHGCKVMDVGDDLVMTISSILISLHNKIDQPTGDITVTCDPSKVENAACHPEIKPVLLQYREDGHNERNCVRDIHDEAVGPLCLESVPAHEMQDEASGISHSSQVSQDCNVPLLEPKVDLIESVENYNGDLAEADQSRHGSETAAASADATLEIFLPDVVDTEEQTPTEAEAEWLGLDGVPTRLQMEDNPENQSGMN